jgi:putative transposase
MREMGLAGAVRGRAWTTTTHPGPDTDHRRDLVDRHFTATRPNQLWVADFTYVATWSGTVYVAFVLDAYSRRILGWRAARSMKTALVLDALEMALWARGRQGVSDVTGLVHHSDAGSQGGFNRSSQHLDHGGVDGQASWMDEGIDRAGADEVAGEAVVAP